MRQNLEQDCSGKVKVKTDPVCCQTSVSELVFIVNKTGILWGQFILEYRCLRRQVKSDPCTCICLCWLQRESRLSSFNMGDHSVLVKQISLLVFMAWPQHPFQAYRMWQLNREYSICKDKHCKATEWLNEFQVLNLCLPPLVWKRHH